MIYLLRTDTIDEGYQHKELFPKDLLKLQLLAIILSLEIRYKDVFRHKSCCMKYKLNLLRFPLLVMISINNGTKPLHSIQSYPMRRSNMQLSPWIDVDFFYGRIPRIKQEIFVPISDILPTDFFRKSHLVFLKKNVIYD